MKYESNEKNIFNLIDFLSRNLIKEKETINLDFIEEDADKTNAGEINQIKNKVYKKLNIYNDDKKINTGIITTNINKETYKKFYFLKIVKTAAVLLILAALITTALSPDYALAQIKKIFEYIPGINELIESNEEVRRYILPHPITLENENGKIEIKSIILENETGLISMKLSSLNQSLSNLSIGEKIKLSNLKNDNIPSSVTIIIDNDNEINLKLTNSISAGNAWEAAYYWKETLNANHMPNTLNYSKNSTMQILIGEYNPTTIKLEKAKEYYTYESIGPTVTVNNLSITVLPVLYEKNLEINVLAPLKNNMSISSFGRAPDYINNNEYTYLGRTKRITLKTKNNIEVTGVKKSDFDPLVYIFDMENINEKNFKFSIPYLLVNYKIDKKFKITVPKTGEEITYNEIIRLNGFNFMIHSVKRISKTTLEFDVDTFFDENADETMYNVRIGSDPKEKYFMTQGQFSINSKNEIGGLEMFRLELNNTNIKTLNLYFENIQTIKKGPWEFNIDITKLNN